MELTVGLRGMGMYTPDFPNRQSLLDASIEGCTGEIVKKVTRCDLPAQLTARDVRRMAALTKYAVLAAEDAVGGIDFSGETSGLYMGLTHGTTGLFCEFHDYLFDYGPEMGSPNAFSNGVTNAALGAVSRYLQITGGGVTLVGYEDIGLAVLNHAVTAIESGRFSTCLVGAAEEYASDIENAYFQAQWLHPDKPEYLPWTNDSAHKASLAVSEGAAFVVIEKPSDQTPWLYSPVESLDAFNTKVDCIVCGASGGKQDLYEMRAILKYAQRHALRLPLVYSKALFGELFAVSPLLSTILAAGIISGHIPLPAYAHHPDFSGITSSAPAEDLRSALILSGNRSGEVSAGYIRRAA